MNRKLFVFLVLLMSLSLVGIIFVQGFWIKNAVENKESQFSFNARQVLIDVSEQIEENEFERYFFAMLAQTDSLGKPDKVRVDEFLQIKEDRVNNETFIYSNSVIQEDYKLFSPFLRGNRDSIEFKKLINKQVTRVIRRDEVEQNKLSAEQRFVRVTGMDKAMKELMSSTIRGIVSKLPIYERVDKEQIKKLLEKGLKKRGLKTDFEFGVYSNGLATKIKTENFKRNAPSTYGVSIFDNDELANGSNYQLLVNFTDKNKEVLSSIILIGLLSIVFTLIIILAYWSALSQLIKQRQISQIKSDFINNMTHEFKTPIATINLALDSIKNPIVSENEEKRGQYLKMIRDENKRMHAQVENVLRISKLEKNELDIKKERLKLHVLARDAVSHISLIVEDRNGYIETHFDAKKSSILANRSHFTNVIINILDNAVKYSEESPKIDLFTENVKNYIILKIQDQGSGMSKTVQKKIFEKFYREHTGDIHNIKGHGLGLAYVKRIVEDHHGEISVASHKGKGSTFTIKLPLIS